MNKLTCFVLIYFFFILYAFCRRLYSIGLLTCFVIYAIYIDNTKESDNLIIVNQNIVNSRKLLKHPKMY